MARDLNDAWGWIERLVRRVDRLYSGALLENSSITNGMLRFIGGLLRLDSGARLEGVGTFQWSGPGSIAGDWEVLEGGVIKVGGVLISPVGGGRIMIGQGPVGIILDGGAGTLTMGNIRMEGGKIHVGAGDPIVIDGATGRITVGNGAAQILIDGTTGKITAGKLTIDPTLGGGAVAFQNGSQVFTDGDTIQVFKGNAVVQVSDSYARLQYGGSVFELNADGLRTSNGVLGGISGTGLPAGTVYRDSNGYLRQSTGA